MNYSDIQHRFANKLEGKNGCIKASSCRYEGRNFYSYSTIFGQWADISKNVVVIFDGSTSMSSSKHKLGKWLFPDDVNVFPYDDGGGYYGWHGCNLLGSYNVTDESFTLDKRFVLIDYYVECIYNQFSAIKGGTTKGLENVDFGKWQYIELLSVLYRDTTISKWLKTKKIGKDLDKKKKMVRLIAKGERDVQTITDALFGDGTYKEYWDYCARYRKQSDKKAKTEALCERLGIASPYKSYYGYLYLSHGMNADQIRKMTAKERNELHFASIMHREWVDGESARKDKYAKNKRNAYKWIVGFDPVADSAWDTSHFKNPAKVRNMYTGEVYDVPTDTRMPTFLGWKIEFGYEDFRKADDKEQWILSFYTECHDYALHRMALQILERVGCETREKRHSWDADRYIDCDVLRLNTTDEEYALCLAYISEVDDHYNREEAEERAREIARIKAEEDRKREEEYRKQVRQAQIDECLERGVEGERDLWRLHLTDIGRAEGEALSEKVFYLGGNVLLRFNLDKTYVETSKRIRIPVEVCKKMWRVVSKWHENPSCFKPMEINTKGCGTYTISNYDNDILTAGCHKIAYAEMARMYNEIVSL